MIYFKEKSTTSMRHSLIIAFCFFFTSALISQGEKQRAYISKYKDIAISEMERAGVPASIKLAQGLLESGFGTSSLARKGNNHFGIKCGGSWKGKKIYHKDDDYDSNGKLTESCFRAYKNAEHSYIAHSDFLHANRRYEFLFRLNPYDYKRWARGLKKAGYATSATYAEKLIKVIDTYDLDQYDRMNANDIIVDEGGTTQEQIQGIILNNDVKLILAEAGDTPQRIADRMNVNLKNILKYNEGVSSPNQILSRDDRVYLQPKRSSFRGTKKYHYVQAGESLYDIAQLYGVKESKLRKRNRIPEGREPAFSVKLKLRGLKIPSDAAPKTSKRTNEVKPVLEVPDESRADNSSGNNGNRPDNRPTRPDPTTVDNDDLDLDESSPITPDKPTSGRRPVLTSDTGERDENYYPPENSSPVYPTTNPDTPVVIPDTPVIVNTDPVYTPPVEDPTPPANNFRTHTVVAGDTLYSISRRYGVTVKQIKDWNGLTDNIIGKGLKLKIE